MCLHNPVSLEDVETKDLAGETGQREIPVFFLKQEDNNSSLSMELSEREISNP